MKSEETIRREQERLRELYRQRKAKALSEVEEMKRRKFREMKMRELDNSDLLLKKVIEKVGGLEKLIEKIGIEKVETVLRAYKIKKLKKEL